jgi:heptosyltransferase-1
MAKIGRNEERIPQKSGSRFHDCAANAKPATLAPCRRGFALNLPSSPAILFVKTSSFGDVVHQMPAVTEARAHFPTAHIAWVVEEPYAPVARLHPSIDAVIPVATRRWRRAPWSAPTRHEIAAAARALRARTYDRIIDTQGLARSAVIARLARGERHGFDSGEVRERFAALAYDVSHRIGREWHAIDRNRGLTAAALGYVSEGPIDYGLARRTPATGKPYAVFLHATARAEKEWPEPQWIGLIREALHRGFEIMLPFGSDAERQRAERLAAATGATVPAARPLDAMAELIGGAAFVAGVDTGLLHLAAALQVPLMGLFVSTAPARTGPRGPGPIVIVDGGGTPPRLEDAIAALERLSVG